ncbi:MAG TPA: type II and III secretion system protein [Treponema sp.]|nr:type II and III secretion system protein [Treponema sp.]
MKKRSVIAIILILSAPSLLSAQRIKKMDFRNQKIADILMVLADMGQQSIIVDDTIIGTATFHFTDSDFEDSLFNFTDACKLFCTKKDSTYYVSRIKIVFNGEKEMADIYAEDVEIDKIVKDLSRNFGRTILYDALPREIISLNEKDSTLQNALTVLLKKFPDYLVEQENKSFYLKKNTESSSSYTTRIGSSAIKKNGELYSMNVPRGSFTSILTLLFKTALREFSLLQRVDANLENLYFSDKTFDQLLRLLLEQANCDFVVEKSVYYIFQIERKDVLKKYKDTIVIQLRNISVTDVSALMPTDYSSSSFMRFDKNTNTVYLTGSTEEIQPIVGFLELIDVPTENKVYKRFEIQYLPAKDFLGLLPKELSEANPQIIPNSNSLVVSVSENVAKKYDEYIGLLDRRPEGDSVRLKYLRTDDLLKNLPPYISKEEIIPTSDCSIFFFTGTKEKLEKLRSNLYIIDQPKPQIRYQLLIMQYQKTDGITWGDNKYDINESSDSPSKSISGNFANLLNIQFDVISEFGYKLAAELNLKITEDKAKVLADTTLNGISGQDIKFENTDVYRYRDYTINTETQEKTGVTREITSGILLKINGWVSGDGMITMDVNAEISKQGDSDQSGDSMKNPPASSERMVTTQVRTKSGTPIIIGGLLQVEKSENANKIPILGSIPIIGRIFTNVSISNVTTEMIIYIVPYVHIAEKKLVDIFTKNGEYFRKYILREAM